MKSLMLLAAVALSVPALAQVQPGSAGRHERVTQIQFDDGDLVEGDPSKPDGDYFEVRGPPVKHSKLIRIRESFRDEVLDSVGKL